ncbi:hypothetical protein IFM89_028890 [Coptis chinensis]|uniref:Uncharacterized protein n=1 Tax=Coptis chinensis TaxID=261450 RepID=A0A835LG39_9MAGN|nr:hypothetical protein IFM89_028890 [Coptis chinensis]
MFFVAAIAWHEKRREWVGDQSQKQQTVPKDPVISWSMTYEDLLSTSEPFSQPIPLPVISGLGLLSVHHIT